MDLGIKFPFEIRDVKPKLNAELKEYFRGQKSVFVQVGPHGYFLPARYRDMAHVYYNMSLRSSDVFVASYPRSATTVTQELVWVVANNFDYEETKTSLHDRFPFLEFSTLFHREVKDEFKDNLNENNHSSFDDNMKELNASPSPRFIKTHLPMSLLPPTLLSTAKIVYVARDPRDVAVSFYHHNRLFRMHAYTGDFKQYWNYFKRDLIYWTPIWQHLKEAWELRHDPNMMFIFYEELTKVAGLVGRADVLACVFFLASLLLYHGCNGKHGIWSSVALAALSMLAKETGLTVMLFSITFDLYRCWSSISKPSSATKWRWKGDIAGRVCKLLASLSVLVGVRLALLHGSLPAFSPQDNPPAFHPSFVVRLLTFSYLAAFNWWLVLCPWSLSHDWQMGSIPVVTSLLDARNLMTCAALIALLALCYRCYMDLELQRHTPAVAGLLLLVIPYLPASNLFVTVGFVVAERVLYIPSVGSVIITAYGIQLLWQHRPHHRPLLIASITVLVASEVAKTHLRNRDWRTKETLLRADLAVLPHNAKLHYNFGNFLKDIEQQENAIKHYKEALRLWPSYASAHNNLGTLVVASGRAEHHFLQALKYNRDHVNAHYNLGKLYRKKNRIVDSLAMLERCIQLEPRFVHAYLELLLLKPEAEKRGLLWKVLELEPSWEHHLLYANWMKGKGFKPPSMPYYLEAMRLAFRKQTLSRDSDLVALRSTCLVLRDLGQQARILQLVTRWHTHRGGPRNSGARNLHLREWRLRAELNGRAMLYTRRHSHTVMSTCLHHSQLEVSPEPYHTKLNDGDATHQNVRTYVYKNSESEVSRIVISNGCQKSAEVVSFGAKKSVSIPAQYKPIHNKSETGHKQKSCPLQKKKDLKESEGYTPYISEHLLKTY